ncbi:hypothetical protein [Bosea sp. 2RAB26]|uniref:hypothetical protein n=1 Tax=Bosea sp. 2RAB26 TaxID=3237476 RepID=UPI003F912BAE
MADAGSVSALEVPLVVSVLPASEIEPPISARAALANAPVVDSVIPVPMIVLPAPVESRA